MDKRYGASQRNDCLMRIGRNKWELIYGYGSDGNMGWNWRKRFPYKPTFDEIKSIVTEQINANTEEIYAAVLNGTARKYGYIPKTSSITRLRMTLPY